MRRKTRRWVASPLFASCDGWRKEEARLVVVARGLIEKRAK